MLAQTEKNFNYFNAGNNINKAICLDSKFGDDPFVHSYSRI